MLSQRLDRGVPHDRLAVPERKDQPLQHGLVLRVARLNVDIGERFSRRQPHLRLKAAHRVHQQPHRPRCTGPRQQPDYCHLQTGRLGMGFHHCRQPLRGPASTERGQMLDKPGAKVRQSLILQVGQPLAGEPRFNYLNQRRRVRGPTDQPGKF